MEIEINSDKLWNSLMVMAKIGETEKGGCCRLALSGTDRKGRDLFSNWCTEIWCTVSIDEMGNIFTRREGRNKELPSVQAGSHLDTQPSGG